MTWLSIGDWEIPHSAKALGKEGWGVLDGVEITFGRQNQLDNPEIGTMRAVIRCETLQAARQAHKIRPGSSVELDSSYLLSHTIAKTQAIKDGWITPYIQDGAPAGYSEWAGNYFVAGSCWIGTGPWDTGNPQEWRYLADKVNPGSSIAVEFTLTAPQYAPAAPSVQLSHAFSPDSSSVCVLDSDPEIKPERLEENVWQFNGQAPMTGEGYPVLYLYAPPVTWIDHPENETWETLEANPAWRIWGAWQVGKTLKLGPTSNASQSVHVFSGVITALEIKGLPGSKSEITITASDHLHPLNAAKIAAPRRQAEPLTNRIQWVLDQTADYLISAGYTPLALLTQSDINPQLQSIDVDARPALDLINQAATSAALTAWPVVSEGGDWGIFLEDADMRPAISYITLDAAGVVSTEKVTTNCLIVDGSQIPLEGVTITKDGEVAATQCEISYPIEKTDPDNGQISYDTAKTLTGEIGPAALKIETWLKNPEDTTETGQRWLRRVERGDWKITGIRIDTARLSGDTSAGQLIDILYRIGQQLVIYSMPQWIPGARSIERFCIEGGSLTAHKSGWIIDLNLTRPGGAGYALKWEEIPAPAIWDKTPLPWARFAALTTKAKIKEGYKDARNN